MTLVQRAFGGKTFFQDIRPMMAKNRGMFSGKDGGFRYACLDATFYKMEVFEKSSSKTFTDAALGLAAVRVVGNGQVFGTNFFSYCFSLPCTTKWQGEIIRSHVTYAGDPASRPDHRHFGQWDGRSQGSFGLAKGDPSSVKNPATYNHALGTLIPLVSGRVRFGAQEVRDTSGKILQYASPGGIGTWLSKPATTGKIIYGVHRSSQVVFVLGQQDGEVGLDIKSVIDRLVGMEVDDAAMGDGSSSAALVIDGAVVITPVETKNNTIPSGVTFQLQTLRLAASSSLTNTSATTDPKLSKSFQMTSVTGEVMQTNDGLLIKLSSLGGDSTHTPTQFATLLGVTLPIELKAAASSMTTPTDFSSGVINPKIEGLALKLDATAISQGTVTGKLKVTNSRGIVVLDVNWPLKT